MIFFYKKTGYPDSVTKYQPKPAGYCITRVTQFRFWFFKIKNHVLQFRFPALAKNQELDQVYTPTITINAPLYAIQFSSCFLLQLVFHAYIHLWTTLQTVISNAAFLPSPPRFQWGQVIHMTHSAQTGYVGLPHPFFVYFYFFDDDDEIVTTCN